MTCSSFIARMMNRYHWIVTLGAAILAFTAAEMMLGDREVAGYFVRHHQISLDRHWDGYMVTQTHPASFPEDVSALPPELKDVLNYKPGAAKQLGTMTFIGQMNVAQRDALLERVTSEPDKTKILELYEETRNRDVPTWIPAGWRATVDSWFQLKWPVENWRGIEGHRHHYVAWIFYALVIAFCLTSPRWWKNAPKESPTEQPRPAEG